MSVGIALPGTVEISNTPVEVAESVASWLIAQSKAGIALRGKFSIALAGGSTPKQLYRLLSSEPRRQEIAWENWEFYFGDERACPPEDPRSNYAMAKNALFDPAAVSSSQIHRMHAEESDLQAAARNYADALIAGVGDDNAVPRLDCVLLGLGENGHTASLFPGDPSLRLQSQWCTASKADYEPFDRLTLTFPTLNAARAVAFMVTGATKYPALQDVIRGVAPAANVAPQGGVLRWFLDQAADSGAAG
jgi:6-phosphogluconolactonase